MARLKTSVRFLVAAAMVAIGIGHFLNPRPFVQIVPAFLPFPLALVYVSGFFEVLGGVGLLIARVRRYAAYGLIALYVAVFPANVNMAIHHVQPEGMSLPPAALWLRLPFQLAFIGLAWWVRKDADREKELAAPIARVA